MKSHGLTQEDIATRLGKSRPYVTNTLRLLNLPEEIIEMVRSGRLSQGHARALIVVDDPAYQLQLAHQALDNKLSVREVEERVRLFFTRKATKGGPRDKKDQSIELKNFVSEMKSVFQTRVKLVGTEQKGRIMIDYFSKDDLERLHALVQLAKYNSKL